MVKRALVAGLLALTFAGAASAQPVDPSTPAVVVRGVAVVETPAEWVDLQWQIHGEGRTQVDALKAMKAGHERLRAAMAGLRGLTKLEAETGKLEVQEVRGDDCKDSRFEARLSTGACAVIGYTAEIEVGARLAPAERIGDAASLASQLGARRVRIGEGGVAQPGALADRAAQAAVANARRGAEAIAAGSGGRLGRILRVQDASTAPVQLQGTTRVEDLLNTLPQTFAGAPAVPLELTPPKVSERADLVVVFALER